MRVGQRLFLTAVPAIVGLFTVVALMYFGEYARQAPEWLLVLAVVATLGSAILARRNARYVARRIEHLAVQPREHPEASGAARRIAGLLGSVFHRREKATGDADELDDIADRLAQLTASLTQERVSRKAHEEAMAARSADLASLICDTVHDCMCVLEEVSLPLHILLENRFGELNENQEEMLGAARSAADAADTALTRLRDVALLDSGALPLRPERVYVQDVLASILPILNAAAAEREVQFRVDLPPALPAVKGDRSRLQDAVSTLLLEGIRAATRHVTLTVRGRHDRDAVQLALPFMAERELTHAAAFATRVIRAHGGQVQIADGSLVLRLPVSVDLPFIG